MGLLTQEEMAYYDGYFSPRRRRDWLLGRWTAKQLIQATVARAWGWTPPLDSFSIGQAANGAPYVQSAHPALCGKEPGCVPIGLSISHSHGHAFCAVAVEGHTPLRLGADIELIEPHASESIDNFFTPAEKAHLCRMRPACRPTMSTATRSAKEAMLKATRLGMRADSHLVECFLHPTRPRHWMPYLIELHDIELRDIELHSIELRDIDLHDSRPDQTPPGSQAFGGWWRIIDNRLRPGTQFVLTLAAQGVSL